MGKALSDFATGSKKNSEEIKKIREEMNEMSKDLLKITLELQHTKQTQGKEQENLVLAAENELLKFERRIAAIKGKGTD